MIRLALARVLTAIVQWLCARKGHLFVFDRSPHELRVICERCGYLSRGIHIGDHGGGLDRQPGVQRGRLLSLRFRSSRWDRNTREGVPREPFRRARSD